MSFIRIVEEKNPIELHNKVYEASKNNELTPEFCMEVLSHTYVPVIMGKMLEEIGKLPVSEQAQYKEIILSMFDFRQTSEKVKNKALELAKNNSFEDELKYVIDKTGDFGYPARASFELLDFSNTYIIKDSMEFYDKKTYDKYDYIGVSKHIHCVYLAGNFSLRGILDFYNNASVVLKDCNLCNVKKIILRNGSSVDLRGAVYLPSDLDVSMCDIVKMNNTDISKVKELKFRNKKQMEDSKLKIPEGWKGKIVYTEDEKIKTAISGKSKGR